MSENNNKLKSNIAAKSVYSLDMVYLLHFVGKDGGDLGHLKENENGQLEFEGDAKESARVFFESVVKLNSEYIKKLENED